MTKKITVYLEDETMEVLDRVAKADYYCKYPKPQVYGIFIDHLIREALILSLCSSRRCGFCI
jgi:hypothetical protein